MFLKQRIAQCMVMSGMMLWTMTCFAQADAPVVPNTPQEVGPATSAPVVPDTPQTVGPATNDRVMQKRAGDRVVVEERVVERRREGEVYVAGFGGFTWGHELASVEGTGSLKGQRFGTLDLADSGVYGAKIGYFHPGRLNWLGVEVEGFNTTPNIEQGSGLPGSHLRVTTLAFNLIARTSAIANVELPMEASR